MRKWMAACVISLVAILSGCIPNLSNILGGGGNKNSQIEGKWSALVTSSQHTNTTTDIETNLVQSSGKISASQGFALSNSPCEFGTDTIEGTVSGTKVSFTLSFGATHPTSTFTGTVSSDATAMSGTYQMPAGDCSAADSGNWSAAHFGSSTGSYSGQFSSKTKASTFGVSAMITEDASNNLQVAANLTGAGCSALNLAGVAIGSILQLKNSGGTVSMIFQASSPTYTTLQAQYTFTGNDCGGADNGTGTLSKSTAAAVAPSRAMPLTPNSESLLAKIQEILDSQK